MISFLGEGRPKGELEEKEKKIGNGGRREGPSFFCEGKKRAAFGLSEIRLVPNNL